MRLRHAHQTGRCISKNVMLKPMKISQKAGIAQAQTRRAPVKCGSQ